MGVEVKVELKRFLCCLILPLLVAALPTQAAEPPGRLEVLGLSLLLPGLGHRALGHSTRAQILMTVEGGLWTAFGGFRLQGKIRKDRYADMAEIFAGVPNAHGRPDEYYRRLGSYRSSEEYNDEVRRDARARWGDDLQARAEYFERHKVPADQVWNWTSSAAWERYRHKRGASLLSYRRSRNMIGLALANRLLAAVDTQRLVHNRGKQAGVSFFLYADPMEPREPARFCVSVPLP